MMRHKSFAVFILSHGRANNIITIQALKKSNYTGKIYIIIDDEDEQEKDYRKIFGDDVIQFCKIEASKTTDVMSPSKKRNAVVFARNECHKIAKDLGIEYFLVLDDDYSTFEYRFADGEKLAHKRISNIDAVFDEMLEFLDVSGAVTVAMAQGGDFIGGLNGGKYKQGLLRKAMNSFFCRTDRPFKFLGLINEDTNAYCLLGSQGKLFFTVTYLDLQQLDTQSNAGGLTDIYLEDGTYLKSFYSVMCMPSAVIVRPMNSTHSRLHHQVKWKSCVPQIISDKWKKK